VCVCERDMSGACRLLACVDWRVHAFPVCVCVCARVCVRVCVCVCVRERDMFVDRVDLILVLDWFVHASHAFVRARERESV